MRCGEDHLTLAPSIACCCIACHHFFSFLGHLSSLRGGPVFGVHYRPWNVANSINGNPNTQKTPFVLPDLAGGTTRRTFAHALHEFVTIERMSTLNDWKTTNTPRQNEKGY